MGTHERALATLSAAFVILAAVAATGQGWSLHLLDPFCHQDPTRSLSLLGGTMGLCARCTGIFVGLATAMAVGHLPRAGRAVLWLGVTAAAALLIEKGAYYLVAADVGNGWRLMIGVGLGCALARLVQWIWDDRQGVINGS